jgi:hypothetical protein
VCSSMKDLILLAITIAGFCAYMQGMSSNVKIFWNNRAA